MTRPTRTSHEPSGCEVHVGGSRLTITRNHHLLANWQSDAQSVGRIMRAVAVIAQGMSLHKGAHR
jgi:hypothetical protein